MMLCWTSSLSPPGPSSTLLCLTLYPYLLHLWAPLDSDFLLGLANGSQLVGKNESKVSVVTAPSLLFTVGYLFPLPKTTGPIRRPSLKPHYSGSGTLPSLAPPGIGIVITPPCQRSQNTTASHTLVGFSPSGSSQQLFHIPSVSF